MLGFAPTILDPPATRTEQLHACASQLKDGDLLLWRHKGIIGRIISGPGRSIYSHAGIVAWWDDCPMVLELREWHGGRATTLVEAIRQAPAVIDHYSIEMESLSAVHESDRRKMVVHEMRKKAGRPYNYAGVLLVGLLRMRLAQVFMSRLPNDKRIDLADDRFPSLPEFCSQAVASAWRYVGEDPVPNLGDAFTEPGDLARSRLFDYQRTLVL